MLNAAIDWHQSLDSTNAEALRSASGDRMLPRWIAARRQTAGRGRSGRSWSDPTGNLAASLIFEPEVDVARLPEFALVAAVALYDAIQSASAGRDLPGLRLKWPNDVLIGDAKIAGILIETTTVGGRQIAVVGCGVNVANTPEVAERAVTCLAAHGVQTTPDALLEHLRTAMANWGEIWARRGFADIREAWVARAMPVGSIIAVHQSGERTTGAVAGLDTDGALLMTISPDDRVQRVTFGDVEVLRCVDE